jgi:hypothetical protein
VIDVVSKLNRDIIRKGIQFCRCDILKPWARTIRKPSCRQRTIRKPSRRLMTRSSRFWEFNNTWLIRQVFSLSPLTFSSSVLCNISHPNFHNADRIKFLNNDRRYNTFWIAGFRGLKRSANSRDGFSIASPLR